MTKPNWNRIAALEFAGRILAGRDDIRAGEAQAHADWALQWLGGDQPNSERPPGECSGPANVPADAIKVRTATDGLADARRRFLGRDEIAPGLVEHLDGNPRNNALENLGRTGTTRPPDPEAPPRNVPTEGDGSMTVPVYRFYQECVDPDCKIVYYWREDTRNLRDHHWSLWSGPEPENGIPCWTSRRDYDEGGQYAPPPVDRMTRLTSADLNDLDIPVETRHDTED